MSLDALIARATAWIAGDPDEATAAELAALVERRAEAELGERMAGPLEFGTAGLRGVLGAGESRMNRAVIVRTTAGLAAYVSARVEDAARRGVVVGHDARHMSRAFAEEAARVLAGAGMRVYLYATHAPTPLTAFAVKDLGAAAGIMVTASHNPPEYNGFKVYWGDGAQIVPPHDRGIAEAIDRVGPANEVERPRLEALRGSGGVRDVPAATLERYAAGVTSLSRDGAGRDLSRIVYTPMHGVGDPFTRAALAAYGFSDVATVPKQRDPDPDFSTVVFPNPEEPGALDLALDLARERNATLVLANDPDADRLAVAVPSGQAGGFRQLTGNEVGVLLGEYLLARGSGPDRLVVTTVVSSPMLGEIAKAMGVAYAETLTGFKWISSTAMRLEAERGLEFVFGYEEALGYTAGTVVRDKDGVSAAALFAELAAVAAAAGRSVEDELERLARTYGLFLSSQRNVVRKGAEGAAAIRATMASLRADPPASVGGRAVTAARDYQARTRRDGAGRVTALDLPATNALALDLEGGARIIARPSGTEPKIKYYFDLREEVAPTELFAAARARGAASLGELEEAFLALAP